ncbi:hypothetical protein BDV12DRAFT_204653 [Aspergillus spectabilis]
MSDLQIQNPVIPPGSLILVTGANGFIASHVVDQLLAAGWRVRGTVRERKRTEWLSEHFDEKYGEGKFTTVEVPDISVSGAFEDAVQGISGVIHVASILTGDPDPNNVVTPLINSSLDLLKSAAKQADFKRFVLTSSSHAAAFPSYEKKVVVDETTFNIDAVSHAWAPPPYDVTRGGAVYAASKVQAEQRIREWVKEHRPDIEVNTVLPSANFGATLRKDHPGSVPWTWPFSLLEGKPEEVAVLSQYYIDVQDDARLHLAALLLPDVKNDRILGYAGVYTVNSLLAILRRQFPEKKIIEDIPNEKVDLTQVQGSAKSEELLKTLGRLGWTTIEESIRLNLEGYP